MRRRATKKAISMALAAAMAFSQVQVFAASSDIKGHWAESAITSWQDKGLITGYTDGTFKPDNSITRAEFASMVNKALGLTEKGDVPFSDVQSGSWYYDAISIAVKAGYCSGYEDGTFKPDATITRAEAAVMIALAKGLTQNTAAASGFADAANIPAWAKGYVGAVVSAGYMSGRPDGTFDATNTITRAEAVSSLDRAMGNTATTDKDVVVTEDDTVIDGQTIEGNLIIDKAVGEGEVYVKNSTVAGNIIVQGGGDDSIYLENVTVKGKVIVEKEDVRVQFEGKTEVTDVEVKAVCELKSKDFEGTVGTITIAEELGTSEAVKVNVPAEAVVVSAKASVYVNANVDKVTIASAAKDSKLEVTSSAKVGTVVADGKVAISGSGKIEKLEANADGITVSSSTKVTETEVADGVEKPSTGSTGGGGGGSSSGSSSSSDDDNKNKPATATVSKLEDLGGKSLEEFINEKANAYGLTLTIAKAYADEVLTGTLNYKGTGKLTINVVEDTKTATLASSNSLKIIAEKATSVSVTGKVELVKLTFNAPKANVLASGTFTTGVEVEAATSATVNAAETAVTVKCNTTVNGTAKSVTLSDSAKNVTIGATVETVNSAIADAKVTVTGKVETVAVKANTTIAGAGTINKVTTSTGTLTVDATNVAEVAVSGEATVRVNADVDKVTVASGAANTTITVGTNAIVSAVNTAANIKVAGSGAITAVTSTTTSLVTVTAAEGTTVKVETVTGSSVTTSGNFGNTPVVKKITRIAIKGADGEEKPYKTAYALDEALDLTGLVLEVAYDGNVPTDEVVVKDNPTVEVTELDSSAEAASKEITISYAGKTATYNISVAMTEEQIKADIIGQIDKNTVITTLTDTKGVTEATAVTEDLPKDNITVAKDTVKPGTIAIEWKSNNDAVKIGEDGKAVTIAQPDGQNAIVTLTATVKYNEKVIATKDYTVTVLAKAELDKIEIKGAEDGIFVGRQATLTAETKDQRGDNITVGRIKWSIVETEEEKVEGTVIEDGEYTAGTGTGTATLKIAVNETRQTITVKVAAYAAAVEEGEETPLKEQTYTVNVKALSNNTGIASVKVADAKAELKGDAYEVTVPYETVFVTEDAEALKGFIVVKTADENADYAVAYESSYSSEMVAKYTVTVTAQDKTEAKYTVNVSKKAPAEVSDFEGLETAMGNADVDVIKLTGDVAIIEDFAITKPVISKKSQKLTVNADVTLTVSAKVESSVEGVAIGDTLSGLSKVVIEENGTVNSTSGAGTYVLNGSTLVKYAAQNVTLRGEGPAKDGTTDASGNYDYATAYESAGVSLTPEEGSDVTLGINEATLATFFENQNNKLVTSTQNNDAKLVNNALFQLSQLSGNLPKNEDGESEEDQYYYGLFAGVQFKTLESATKVTVYSGSNRLASGSGQYEFAVGSNQNNTYAGNDVLDGVFTKYLVFANAEKKEVYVHPTPLKYTFVWSDDSGIIGVTDCTINYEKQ